MFSMRYKNKIQVNTSILKNPTLSGALGRCKFCDPWHKLWCICNNFKMHYAVMGYTNLYSKMKYCNAKILTH